MQTRGTFSTELQSTHSVTSSLNTLACHIGILQQIQYLFSQAGLPEATLADIVSLILDLQQEYGFVSPVEDVIQDLVGRHLLLQYQARRKRVEKIVA